MRAAPANGEWRHCDFAQHMLCRSFKAPPVKGVKTPQAAWGVSDGGEIPSCLTVPTISNPPIPLSRN